MLTEVMKAVVIMAAAMATGATVTVTAGVVAGGER
jgi:hypothetical protein